MTTQNTELNSVLARWLSFIALQRRETISNFMFVALIATGIVLQVQLMIVLGVVPRSGHLYLGRDGRRRPLLIVFPFPLHLCLGLLRNLQLFFRVGKDGGSILRTGIPPLPVLRRWVVGPEEEFDQGFVADFVRIEENQQAFGVSRRAGADGSV
jgi:hypothetical protein